jgi:uncharacterized repeat protein (TIGR03806 family)
VLIFAHSKAQSWRWIALVILLSSLETAFALEAVPQALYPNGPIAESPSTFEWTAVAGATAYRVNVRNAANQWLYNRWFSSQEAGCANGEDLCVAPADIEFESASFRWRVIARDDDYVRSGWSAWRVFHPGQSGIPDPPKIPLTLEPVGSSQSNRPDFVWEAVDDASIYRLVLKDDRNRTLLNVRKKPAQLGCADDFPACSLEPDKWLAEGSYRWKILAKNKLSGRSSGWSPWSFFNVPGAAQLGSGLDHRPANPTCTLPNAPPRFSNVAVERVFSGLPISKVVVLVSPPGTEAEDDRLFAVSQGGRIFAFDASDSGSPSSYTFLDISDRVLNDTGETGLLGMAFHPDFPADNRAFVFYVNKVDGVYRSYLSEFLTLDGGQSLDPGTEQRLITVTGHATHNHKGGTVIFGPDGYLYLALGDGGARNESQNPFSLLGSMVRIDVDSASPYAIPTDNGFRNPWRWSFDSLTGLIWLTDVGQSTWEEINILQPGANYGWPILEGPDCYLEPNCNREGLTPPIFAYRHDESGGIVVVGGFVYRGQEFPELEGTFIYADGTNRVWALYVDEEGQPDPQLLIDGDIPGGILHSMFEDRQGELYLVKGGIIHRIVRGEEENEITFPATLSETGCVDPEHPTVPADGLIPYGVTTAFWTDGAAKRRWLAMPDGAFIDVDADGDFQFPPGSVLVKEFSLNGRRIETRLFARHEDGEWGGYTYAWDDDETEANLVDAAGRQIDVDGQNYTLPGRNDCLFCHSEAAGRTLGLEIRQLNRQWSYVETGRMANQLTTFEAIGLLRHALPASPENLPALVPLGDHQASFSDRARSYLHTNCSSCHRPGGPGRGPADMRFQPLQEMNICDVHPEVDDLGIADARLLAPGAPERSIIAVRLGQVSPLAMPPIGKNVVDVDATAVVEEWIAGLESCTEE